jgi:hypothetical protein
MRKDVDGRGRCGSMSLAVVLSRDDLEIPPINANSTLGPYRS